MCFSILEEKNGLFKFQKWPFFDYLWSFFWHLYKGQLISKRFLGSSISSKKWTKKFVFTTVRNDFVRFLEEIDDLKKPFRNWLIFSIFLFFYVLENFTIEGILLINWRIKSSLLLANHLLLIQWQYCSLKIGWYIFHPVLVDHFFVIFLESSGLMYG